MHRRIIVSLLGLSAVVALAGSAKSEAPANAAGVWQVMSLGTDRKIEVWQQGDRFTAHRVMFPEFEGERYKLEHLFSGKLDGAEITGTLYVREEGMKAFDELRSFTGRISGADKMTLDGLPLARGEGKSASTPPSLQGKGRSSGHAPLSLNIHHPICAARVNRC